MGETTATSAGPGLDRDASTRPDPAKLAAAWKEPDARVLRLNGLLVPVTYGENGAPRLALTPAAGDYLPARTDGRVGHCFLGRVEGAPVFAELVDETDDSGVVDDGDGGGESSEVQWRHPFEVGTHLEGVELELMTVAAALLRWHESAGFSPRDGEPTTPALGGWGRHDVDGGEHFPRTDPAVIVLIEHENRVLLGSNTLWESGRFSLLAGFVEAGESAEDAVFREVFEESGVRLGRIEYIRSQPWPYPRSLMLGFRAELAEGVDPEALVPDPEEISELRWFTREELRNPGPGLRLPMPMSIAGWMIQQWVEGSGRER